MGKRLKPLRADRRDVKAAPEGALLYDLDTAARLCAMSRAQMERIVARGVCASVKIGRMRRVSARQLAAYVEQLEQASV